MENLSDFSGYACGGITHPQDTDKQYTQVEQHFENAQQGNNYEAAASARDLTKVLNNSHKDVVESTMHAVTQKDFSSEKNNIEQLNTEEMKILIKASRWMKCLIKKDKNLLMDCNENINDIIKRVASQILHKKDKQLEKLLDKVKVVVISHDDHPHRYYGKFTCSCHVIFMVRHEEHTFIIDPASPSNVYKINKRDAWDEESESDATSVTEISGKNKIEYKVTNCWYKTCYRREFLIVDRYWPQFRFMNARSYSKIMSLDHGGEYTYAMMRPLSEQAKPVNKIMNEILKNTDGVFNYKETETFFNGGISFEELMELDPVNRQQKPHAQLSNDHSRIGKALILSKQVKISA